MGICYYLWREDNRTAYELGKAYGWEAALGRGTPMSLRPEDAPTLAELLELTLTHDEEGGYAWWSKEDVAQANANTPSGDYFGEVAASIAKWSDGQLFEFVSENDGRIEARSMEAYDADDERDTWITGSRFRD